MIAESYGENMFILVGNCKTLFQIHSAFLPTMNDSSCSISLSTFDVVSVLYFIHFNGYVVFSFLICS